MRRWMVKLGIVVGTISVLLLVFGLIYREKLAVQYFVNFSTSPREVPVKYIRPLFALVTEQELPEETKMVRALFQGGFDPCLFVEFEADPDVIKEFLMPFLRFKLSEDKIVDPDFIRYVNSSGSILFFNASVWQKELGIKWFDQTVIRHGRLIEYLGPPGTGGFKILVDDDRSIVYAYVYQL